MDEANDRAEPSVAHQRKPLSLYDFIEANQRLLTAFATFVALTAFLIQATAGDDALSKFVPGIPLFGALLLILELFLRMPADGAEKSGRLLAFELVVLALGGSLAWMWFKRFPTAWGTVLLSVSFMLVIVVAAGIGYLAGIPFRWLLPRLLHRDLKANEQQLLSRNACLIYRFNLGRDALAIPQAHVHTCDISALGDVAS